MLYHNLILFDGVCNLCNASVNFVIDHDKQNLFHFASLQSTLGQAILAKNNFDTQDFNSFVLVYHGNLLTKSTAALTVAIQLGILWKLLAIFWIVPSFIRDGIYSYIAKNRYHWFGKNESCRLPTPELRNKFLDI